MAGILNVFRDGELEIRDKYSFDFPPIGSEADWKNLVDEFVIKEAQEISASLGA